jgi:peptidoglycan pentaglycine glycine transferase (the first glycine)
MIFKSASITLASPSFGEDIAGAVGYFWNTQHSSAPVWQTSGWCEFLLDVGQVRECIFVGIYSTDAVLAGYAFVQVRDIGLGYTGGFIVGGPNLSQTVDTANIGLLFTEIERILDQTWVVFAQYEPVQDLGFTQNMPLWKYFVEPYTLTLDLTLSEDELLAQMKQKGRYNIKLAEKQGVTIELSHLPNGLDHFMRLLNETLDRDGFSGNSRTYYAGLLAARTHVSEGLYLAHKDWLVIAAAILVMEWDQAIYYYWASTSDNELRKSMPAYLLQWRMIQAAKSAGCTQYDFLGIAPPGSEDHPLAGVSDFKHKFGGQIGVLPAKKISVHRSPQYYLLRMLRKMRWLFVK